MLLRVPNPLEANAKSVAPTLTTMTIISRVAMISLIALHRRRTSNEERGLLKPGHEISK